MTDVSHLNPGFLKMIGVGLALVAKRIKLGCMDVCGRKIAEISCSQRRQSQVKWIARSIVTEKPL